MTWRTVLPSTVLSWQVCAAGLAFAFIRKVTPAAPESVTTSTRTVTTRAVAVDHSRVIRCKAHILSRARRGAVSSAIEQPLTALWVVTWAVRWWGRESTVHRRHHGC